MADVQTITASLVFILTVVFLIWRPKGINEAVPVTIGAAVLLLTGIVPFSSIGVIAETVSGAAITILSTIVMSIVLDSIGFFRWAALNIIEYARGSGVRLYWCIIGLCFLMTLFFNNDGSILITTPIILQIGRLLQLKVHQQLPYLISGALIATAASAPIGVSNLANLIALKIVGLDLNSYALMMFLPSMIGISAIGLMLYFMFRRKLPIRIQNLRPGYILHSEVSDGKETTKKWFSAAAIDRKREFHPLMDVNNEPHTDWWLFRVCIIIVIATRAGFFIASGFGVPIEWIAISGAALLIAVRWLRTGRSAKDLATKTPWHILLFAFGIYVIVDGLQQIGLTRFIVRELSPLIAAGDLSAIFVTGGLLTIMSNVLNNLPSVMIGTLSLTQMNLDPHTLQLAYLANILGSDIGALITPLGTLASLIWMFILRQHHVKLSWKEYMKVTALIIPVGLLISLLSLYFWTRIIG
jgi:arsenical pump membrane protein